MADDVIGLVVNAGGQSRRMGQPKALLPMPHDSTPLIVHIVRRLAPLVSDRVVVVTNDEAVGTVVSAGVSTVGDVLVLPDQWVEGGALGGVATGLAACEGWAMVVACDMPLVDPAIFAKLIEVARQRPTLDAIIPRVAGQAQPFHGLWHRRALPVVEARVVSGALGVQGALALLDMAWMDADALGIDSASLAFMNVNTPQEWAELLAILGDQTGR